MSCMLLNQLLFQYPLPFKYKLESSNFDSYVAIAIAAVVKIATVNQQNSED